MEQAGAETPLVDGSGGGPMRVAIVVFDTVDLLDVGGPYEVLLTASRLVLRSGRRPPFEVLTVGAGKVEAYGGLGLVPTHSFESVGDVDLLIIPGAIDVEGLRAQRPLLGALKVLADKAATVASVCSGAFVLADLGLLPNHWTTHWEDVGNLEVNGGSRADDSVRWVDAGGVVTSGGLSSGIAMTLHLVERFAGSDLARATALQLDYEWDPAGARTGLAATARS